MTPRRIPVGPGIVLLLSLLAGGWFLQQGIAQDQDALVQSRLFQEVLDHIADRYVDDMDRNTLYQHAIEGLLNELGDPNTSLLNVEAYENFRIQTEGDYGGVGLEISDRDDFITVVAPIPGTPGFRAGIRAGDEIVEVRGESTRDWPVQQAVQELRGPPGTDVEVRIRRPGIAEPIAFTLTRERIQLHSVPFAIMMDGGVGYIPLGLFSETSVQEVRAAADSLRSEGATSFILDLRGNPGGVLDQGVGITDLFLPRGSGVVETRGRDSRANGTLRTSSDDRYEGMPIVVLVDRGSASASEIVAGALQDYDRALLIGSSTFGKGSVQSLFSLSGGNVLKLTTARWYTPRGRSIERMAEHGSAVEPPPNDADPDAVVEPDEEADHVAISVTGQLVLPPDTAGRPTVTSAGGRLLYAGGGIVPDLLVSPDTMTGTEQAAVRALIREAGRYRVGVFNHAVDYLQRNPDIGPGFELTESDLEALYDRLVSQQELSVDRATFLQAERFVRYDLESEIIQQGWGELESFQRRVPHDAPLLRALEVLHGASSPEELFSRTANGGGGVLTGSGPVTATVPGP